MREDAGPAEVAAALQLSIGLFVRRTRQSPVRDELSVPEMAALSRLDREGPATASDLARAERITPQGMGGDGRQVVREKRSARTRQLAQVLSEAFTSQEREVLAAAAPLIARLGEILRRLTGPLPAGSRAGLAVPGRGFAPLPSPAGPRGGAGARRHSDRIHSSVLVAGAWRGNTFSVSTRWTSGSGSAQASDSTMSR